MSTPGRPKGEFRVRTEVAHDHKVLIADDEPNIVDLARVPDEARGLRGASSRATARRRWTRSAASGPQLVLLDVMMPKKSGFDVCQAVRADDGDQGHEDPDAHREGPRDRHREGVGDGRRRLHDEAVLDAGAGAARCVRCGLLPPREARPATRCWASVLAAIGSRRVAGVHRLHAAVGARCRRAPGAWRRCWVEQLAPLVVLAWLVAGGLAAFALQRLHRHFVAQPARLLEQAQVLLGDRRAARARGARQRRKPGARRRRSTSWRASARNCARTSSARCRRRAATSSRNGAGSRR